ncbi:MAG: hypothetical protein AAGN35_08015 [Bacteroidota bacterium]
MRRTDSLFQLVKSLNRTDKRNFRLLTQLTSGNKKYLKLFAAIDRQSVYDENRLLRQFKGDSMVKQFSVTKNYLYNSILRSLAHFYRGPAVSHSRSALYVRILIDKGLQVQAEKILRKARKRAGSVEDFNEVLDLIGLEREILRAEENVRDGGEQTVRMAEEERAATTGLLEIRRYQQMLDEVRLRMLASRHARQPSDVKQLATILGDRQMQADYRPGSHRSEGLRLRLQQCLAIYQNQPAAGIAAGRAVAVLFAEHKFLRVEWGNLAESAVQDVIRGYIAHGQLVAAEDLLEEVLDQAGTDCRVARINGALNRLLLALFRGDPRQSAAILAEVGTLLREERDQLPKSVVLELCYHAAWMSLVANDAKEALRWINAFLNEPRSDLRQDLQSNARLLNLLVHYELGNDDLVEHNLKSTIRFIFKRNRMCQVERLVVRTVRMLIQAKGDGKQERILKAMQKELDLLRKIEFEATAMETLFLPIWLGGKLQHRPMAELLRLRSREV